VSTFATTRVALPTRGRTRGIVSRELQPSKSVLAANYELTHPEQSKAEQAALRQTSALQNVWAAGGRHTMPGQ